MARAINGQVEKIIKKIARKKNFSNAKVLTDWHYIVGDELAEKTIPWKISFDKFGGIGNLHVNVRDSVAALELSYQTFSILEKISIYFGNDLIKKIKIKQNSQIFTRKLKTKEPLIKKLLKPEEQSKIESELENIHDDELKNALRNLAISVKSSNIKQD